MNGKSGGWIGNYFKVTEYKSGKERAGCNLHESIIWGVFLINTKKKNVFVIGTLSSKKE